MMPRSGSPRRGSVAKSSRSNLPLAKSAVSILMEGEEEAFARVREASMFVSPYLEEAPDTVDRMYHTDSAGRCVLTVCMMLALCLLAGWIKRSRAV